MRMPSWSNNRSNGRSSPTAALCFSALAAVLAPSLAGAQEPPPPLETLQEIVAEDDFSTTGLEIRVEALREAALSYGARGGLANRTFQIRARLDAQSDYLSRIFDFRRLLIPGPSGLLLEPPVISESFDAILVEEAGQSAAVADQILQITEPARIVAAPRDWRSYLERDYGDITPPPALLLPENAQERERWREWVAQGWDAGIAQADEIFQADVDRMVRDFTGMVRYRRLVAQAMVSPPFVLEEDRGITGGGSEMRVGDRGLRITGPSSLQPQGGIWAPAERPNIPHLRVPGER